MSSRQGNPWKAPILREVVTRRRPLSQAFEVNVAPVDLIQIKEP